MEISGVRDLVEHFAAGRQVKVRGMSKGQPDFEFDALVRIDHTAGSPVLRERRDSAVCAEAIAGDEEGVGGRLGIIESSYNNHPVIPTGAGAPATAEWRDRLLNGRGKVRRGKVSS